jgi:hypothetical protein
MLWSGTTVVGVEQSEVDCCGVEQFQSEVKYCGVGQSDSEVECCGLEKSAVEC